MQKFILVFVILVSCLISYGQSTDSTILAEFRPTKTLNGNKVKLFINGNPVNDNLYDGAREFVEGFAAVKRNNKWCFIDMTGAEISAYFKKVEDFSNGFAIVTNDNYDHDFIDTSGELLTNFRYDKVFAFKEGYAVVIEGLTTSNNGRYGYINTQGEEVISPKYDRAENFIDGAAEVRLGDKVGLVNENGEIITPIIYYRVDNIGLGLRQLWITENNRTRIEGVVNNKGEWLFKMKGKEFQEVVASIFDEYLVVMGYDNNSQKRYGIIDQNGDVKIELNFEVIKWYFVVEGIEVVALGFPTQFVGIGEREYFAIDKNLDCVNAEWALPCPD